MISETLVYLHSHAVNRLEALAQPQAIITFIKQLKSNPTTIGDYRQPDPQGRIIEVKILGRHAVLFFNDPFAGLIKVLDIRNVEAM
jgi:hypothetical protein